MIFTISFYLNCAIIVLLLVFIYLHCILQGIHIAASKTARSCHFILNKQNISDAQLVEFYANLRFVSAFHTSPYRAGMIPVLLSDIGEGITEVTIKEWLVYFKNFIFYILTSVV